MAYIVQDLTRGRVRSPQEVAERKGYLMQRQKMTRCHFTSIAVLSPTRARRDARIVGRGFGVSGVFFFSCYLYHSL